MDIFTLAPFVMEPQNMEELLGLPLSYTLFVTHVQRSSPKHNHPLGEYAPWVGC